MYSKIPSRCKNPERYFRPGSELEDASDLHLFGACRASSVEQEHSNDHQEKEMIEHATKYGITLVPYSDTELTMKRVCSGRDDPIWFEMLHDLAQRVLNGEADGILIEHQNRLIRSTIFHSVKNPEAEMTDRDAKFIRETTMGIPLYSIIHPCTPPLEVLRLQQNRGRKYAQNKGGGDRKIRRKKRKRIAQIEKAVQMRNNGASWSKVSEILDVKISTVRGWLKRPEMVPLLNQN